MEVARQDVGRERLGERWRGATTYSTIGSSPSATIFKPWGEGSTTAIGEAEGVLASGVGVSLDMSDGGGKWGAAVEARLRDRDGIGSSREKYEDRDEDMATYTPLKCCSAAVDHDSE